MIRGARRFTRARRAVQASVAIAFLVLPLANAAGWRTVSGTLAGLGFGGVRLAEPASALSAVLAAGGAGLATLAVSALPLVVLALVLGPVYCSWLCPFGLLSEGLDRLRQGRRARWSDGAAATGRRARTVALLVLLGGSILLGAPLAAIVAGPRLATALPLEALYLGSVSALTGALLLALLALEVLGPRRLWCRALCPAGALASHLRTPRTLGVAYDPEPCSCTDVPACLSRCRWGVDPRRMDRLDGCTSCLECVDACPSGALRVSFALAALSAPRRAHRAARSRPRSPQRGRRGRRPG